MLNNKSYSVWVLIYKLKGCKHNKVEFFDSFLEKSYRVQELIKNKDVVGYAQSASHGFSKWINTSKHNYWE
jgi:hypothetical protein